MAIIVTVDAQCRVLTKSSLVKSRVHLAHFRFSRVYPGPLLRHARSRHMGVFLFKVQDLHKVRTPKPLVPIGRLSCRSMLLFGKKALIQIGFSVGTLSDLEISYRGTANLQHPILRLGSATMRFGNSIQRRGGELGDSIAQ